VTDAAVAWLRERDQGRRFFLWVHYFDPHVPYERFSGFDGDSVTADRPGERVYLGEVARADAAFGRLVDVLRELGLYEDTAIAVIGDHGEGLGDHGEATHAPLVFDSTLRVPMILRAPDGFRAGEESHETVSVVDFHPTALTLLGLEADPNVDGIDLRDGAVPPERGVYFESYYGFLNFGWSPITGWAQGGTKLLHAGRVVGYDTAADPSERRPLADDGRVERLAREARDASDAILRRGTLDGDTHVDADVVARLESLGYATGSSEGRTFPPPFAPSDRPSPIDAIAELDEMNRTDALLAAGRTEEGIAAYERIVAANPHNAYALANLATALENAGRTAAAASHWEQLIALGDTRVATRLHLAACYAEEGEHARAAPLLESILEDDPGNRDASRQLLGLAAVAERTGDTEAAAGYRAWLQRLRDAGREE